MFYRKRTNNPEDNYAVCIKKNDHIIGHFPLGKSSNFTRFVFYFSKADEYSLCEVAMTG